MCFLGVLNSLNGKLSLKSTENNLINLTKQQKNNQSPNTNYNKQLKRIVAVDERAGGGGGGGGGSRRYKTPSPQLLRLRREAANARERRRMNHLNKAFDRLRNVLPPNFEEGRRLSKFETLLGAQEYIIKLGEYLEELKKGKRIDKSFLKELK
uniref:BHLH domain-containing protein n=1 Tax=Meloidogyne incognita TaxID=6306 RepID=A0A914L8D5_MELIC